MARIAVVLASALCFLFSLSQAACNGYDALCSRRYSNVSQIGTHNSAFVGNFLTQNQHLSVTAQLNRGIRFLQAQTHDFDDTIKLCHSSCLELDAGTLATYLTTIKTWLDASNNTNEVLTLLLTNPDSIAVSEYGTIFSQVGIDKYAYAPSGTLALNAWPTLQQLIDSGKRLVVFMDYHADTSSVPYILDEFTYFFETPYETTDASWPQCSIDRPSGSSASGKMYIMNHFLQVNIFGIYIPDIAAAETTNSQASIDGQAAICLKNYARAPKAVLVDYFEKGNVFAAERDLNSLSTSTKRSKKRSRWSSLW